MKLKKNKRRLSNCKMNTGAAMLLILLTTFPLYAQAPTDRPESLTGNLSGYYSGLEVEKLIEEISGAAHEAIENAAGEAAKAAFIECAGREAAAYYEAERYRLEVETLKTSQKNTRKNILITGVICLLSGLTLGAGGVLLFGGR